MSDCAEKDGITSQTYVYGFLRERIAGFVDRISAHEAGFIIELMTVMTGDGIQYPYCLGCYFRSYPVPGYDSNVFMHGNYIFAR
jgi:hypothetical protein